MTKQENAYNSMQTDETTEHGGEHASRNNANKIGSMQTRKKQQTIFIVAMMFIPIAYWLYQWLYINGTTIAMAFQNNDGAFSLENFVRVKNLLTNKQGGLQLVWSLKNTIKTFFCTELIGVPISLVMSYFIYKQIRGYKFFRIVFYLPHIIPGIVLITVFKQLLSPLGPFTALCNNIGIVLPEEGLLHTTSTAMNTIIFYCIWTTACANILFYSSMSRIPPELIEVGKLEGLQLFKELIYVVMPLIWPTFSTTIVLDLTGILNAGGPVLLFGVNDVVMKARATTLPYWFFSQVYDGGISGIGSYGVMSCVGLMFTAISVPFTLFIRYLLNKVETAEY